MSEDNELDTDDEETDFAVYGTHDALIRVEKLPKRDNGQPRVKHPTEISIEEFGCKPLEGDPQAAFDNAPKLNEIAGKMRDRQIRCPIFIPGKNYAIRDTWTLPERSGYSIKGNGITYPMGEAAQYRGCPSILTWLGPRDKPMVHCRGFGLRWDNICLQGRYSPSGIEDFTGERASKGLLLTADSGTSAGKLTVPAIQIAECDEALDLGGGGQVNSDNSVWGLVWIQRCGRGLHLHGTNAVGHSFRLFHTAQTPESIRIDKGGELYIAQFSHQDGDVAVSVGETGINHANYYFGQMIADNAMEDKEWHVLKMDQNVSHAGCPMFVFNNGLMDSKARNHNWEVRGNTALRINNWNWLRSESILMLREKDTDPHVVVSNSRLTSTNVLEKPGSIGGALIMNDCCLSRGQPA